MGRIEIDETRCKGCGLCVIVCPHKVISLSEQVNLHGCTPAMAVSLEKCTGCTFCAQICPDVAIAVFK